LGKGGNTEAIKRAGILILTLLFGCGYIITRQGNLTYYGWFRLYLPDKMERGRWQAVEENGKIDKIYILSNLGFPVATISFNKGEPVVNGKEPAPQLKTLLQKAATILPQMARGRVNYIQLKGIRAYAFERGELIFIIGRDYMLEIRITALRSL